MPDHHIERLSAAHAGLLDTFVCTKSASSENLTSFLRERALHEQEQLCNTTYLIISANGEKLDAYVTLSTGLVGVPPRWRQRQGVPRSEVPAMFIGYIAVDDGMLGKGLGLQILDWVKLQAFRMNEFVGIRVLYLEVEAANWPAFRVYADKWRFTPIPLKATDAHPQVRQPNPGSPNRPPNIEPKEMIGMFYDLYNEFGSFAPSTELGLADA